MQKKFSPTIIIISAGEGKRMSSTLPKVLHQISMQPMIEYVIKLALRINPHSEYLPSIVVNQALLDNKIFQELLLQYKLHVVLQKEKLGTGDATQCAFDSANTISDLVLVLYGDTPFVTDCTIKQMYLSIIKGADLCILGFRAMKELSYGEIVLDSRNYPIKIIEGQSIKTMGKVGDLHLYNSGVLLVKKYLLGRFFSSREKNVKSRKEEFYLTDIVDYSNKNNYKCHYVLCDKLEAIGINNRLQLIEAEQYNQDLITQRLIRNGVTIINPKSSFFANDVTIEKDVTIYPNVFIGSGVKIQKGATIRSFSYIEGAIIENNTLIGPFTRIRPNTRVGGNSRIGNFVEIKNANLKNNVKANHTSYIGDVDIEKNVNIGAGAVFCNYDGYNKHRTYVEENAFIGSNSSIISPIKIGANSTIGAGSVVNRDIEAGDLAIARSRQVNLKKKSKL